MEGFGGEEGGRERSERERKRGRRKEMANQSDCAIVSPRTMGIAILSFWRKIFNES